MVKKTNVKAKKSSLSKAAATMKSLAKAGVKKVTIFYTREVNGKRVPNYKTISLTAGVLALAGAGAYAYKRHKKYGHVFMKKKK